MKKHLFIIPLHFPWNWTTDYYKQSALALKKNHHNVIFYNAYNPLTFKQFFSWDIFSLVYTEDGFTFFTPIELVPFRRFSFVKLINASINKVLFFLVLSYVAFTHLLNKTIVLHCFSPNDTQLTFLFRIATFSIYDCVDYPGDLNEKNQNILIERETQLIKQVDYFFTNSQILKQLHDQIRESVLIPQGFRLQAFSKRQPPKTSFPTDKPLIGFVGGINYRLDFKLLNLIITQNRDKNFVLWGPELPDHQNTITSVSTQLKKLRRHPNLFWGSSTTHEDVPSVIKQFDIAIIPYDISQKFNKYCYPMKLFEYFYIGKPILTTPIQELVIRNQSEFQGLVYIGHTANEWTDLINQLLKEPWPKRKQLLQKKYAEENSWESKIHKILKLTQLLPQKAR